MEELPIQLLKYLKEQGATYKKIDIAAPFLLEDDSKERRLEVSQVVAYLEKEGFIILDGYPPSLSSTMAGQFPSKYITGIRASITKAGEKEIEPPKESVPSHYVHMEHVTNPIVNSPIQDSRLEIKTMESNNIQTNNPVIKKPTVLLITMVKYIILVLGFIGTCITIYEFFFKKP
jgi:hypothetical protein